MRVGAIGVGIHALTSILPNLPGAGMTLSATCARHLDRAEAAAARFGARAAFDDAERMLDAVALEGVVVVVPPDQFSSVVRACIRRGFPSLLKNPRPTTPPRPPILRRKPLSLAFRSSSVT